MARIAEWRVHIGAHKTATTHLQTVLAARRAELNDHGVDFLPLNTARPLFLRPASTHRRLAQWRKRLDRWPALARRADALTLPYALRRAARCNGTLVLSEENLLGGCATIFSPTLYPDLSRLAALRPLARSAPLRVFLSIRPLDGYLPSAYAEVLKNRRQRRSAFLQAVERWSSAPPSWADLLCRVQQELPSARLEVWNYDHYAAHWPAIHTAFTGVQLGPGEDPGRPLLTRTPGESAIRAAEALELGMAAGRPGAVRQLYSDSIEQNPEPRFDPLDAAQHRALQAAFARDLAEIGRRFPDALHRFAA